MLKLAILSALFVSILSEVVFVAEVARHGARVPAQMFPWDKKSKQWVYGKDELTPLGMRQHFLLGAELRERYIVQEQLLSASFSAQEVSIIASDLDRTIDSAQSQLRGLFPPSTGPQLDGEFLPPISVENLTEVETQLADAALPSQSQVFPVPVTPILDDLLLRPKYACAKIVNWTAETGDSLVYNETASSNPEVIAVLEEALPGVDVVNQFININNNIKCNLFQGLPLPAQFTPAVLANISEVFNEVFSLFYEDDNIARLYSSALLIELQQRIQGVLDGTEPSLFRLYMTNEETLAGLLAGMQVFDYKQPVFASAIIFQVSRNESGLTVRVTYNDAPLLIPTCGSYDCPVQAFLSYLSSRAFPDFEALCSSPTWEQGETMRLETTQPQWMGVGLFAIAAICYGLQRGNRRENPLEDLSRLG